MATASPIQEGQASRLRGSGTIVLAIEKTPVRARYAAALESCGFAVRQAADGEDALIFLSNSVAKVLVLDLALPDADGIEICRQARELHGNQLSILFLSPVDDLDVVEVCFEFGANDFLVEGPDLDEFLERVHYWATARPIHKQQRHRARTLAAIRAAVHDRLLGDEDSMDGLTSDVDSDVSEMTEIIDRARHAAGADYGRTMREKLCLLGYVAGVIEYWATLRAHIKIRRDDYFRAVLRETGVLSPGEIKRMLSAWDELREDRVFSDALKYGARDAGSCSCNGGQSRPVGLQRIDCNRMQCRNIERFQQETNAAGKPA